jgi:hypothetical protein
MVTRANLLRTAIDEFAFMREEGECAVEVVEPNTLLTTVAYIFSTIAVELRFDWRDLDVMCCLSMPSRGGLPAGYLVHEGKRIRFRLDDLTPEVRAKFGQLGLPPKRRPPLEQWTERQSNRMVAAIRIYAEILRSDFANLRFKAEASFYPEP